MNNFKELAAMWRKDATLARAFAEGYAERSVQFAKYIEKAGALEACAFLLEGAIKAAEAKDAK